MSARCGIREAWWVMVLRSDLETLRLTEVRPLIGKNVEIFIIEETKQVFSALPDLLSALMQPITATRCRRWREGVNG